MQSCASGGGQAYLSGSDADSSLSRVSKFVATVPGHPVSRAMAALNCHGVAFSAAGYSGRLHFAHRSSRLCSAEILKESLSHRGLERLPKEGYVRHQPSRERPLISGTKQKIRCKFVPGTSICSQSSNVPTNYIMRKRTVVASVYRSDDPLYLLSDNNGEGPIELAPKDLDIDPFAVPQASTPQIIASTLLTGTIAVLLFRALRRRARRAKDMQFRSSGVSKSKSIKEEARKAALASLTKSPEIPERPPTAAQTAFGAVVAGVIALVLYRFTTLVEASFSSKAVSQDYSVRNLTITVRTIISGLCYLATFVFAANSIGLSLYALQILLGIKVSENPPPKNDPNEKENSEPIDKSDKEDVKKE